MFVGKRIKVADAIKYHVNAKSLQFECARIQHKGLLMTVLMYGGETMA